MITKYASKVKKCRICHKNNLRMVFALGSMPLANSFLQKKHLNLREPSYPLNVYFCSHCYLLQLGNIVPAKVMFTKYLYESSTSKIFVKHFEQYAKKVHKKFDLNTSSFVVDIGSNDGILLKPFKKLGVGVLGIDPAVNLAKKATNNGIITLPVFFDKKIALKVFKKYGGADIVCANNVFAHVNNLDEFTDAVKILLKKGGVLVIEVPYLVDMLKKRLFDTIYHEHLSYISIRPLKVLFKKHQMKIIDVNRVDSHGGSIRIFIARSESKYSVSTKVEKLILLEKKHKLEKVRTYINFANQIEDNKKKLNLLLKNLKLKNKKIIAFGAAAKANTLLNYFKIGRNTIDYIVDDSPLKQGKYTPGSHIEIVSDQKILSDKPDYILILAWNFADLIMKKYSSFKKRGGHFILPVPKPRII